MNAYNISLIVVRLYGAICVVTGIVSGALGILLFLVGLEISSEEIRTLISAIVGYIVCVSPIAILAGIALVKLAPWMANFAIKIVRNSDAAD